MSYFGEVYMKLYILLTSLWWVFWSILLLGFLISLLPIHIEKWKYKGQYTYFGIIFFSITMVVGLISWIFLPSPELLGLVK